MRVSVFQLTVNNMTVQELLLSYVYYMRYPRISVYIVTAIRIVTLLSGLSICILDTFSLGMGKYDLD